MPAPDRTPSELGPEPACNSPRFALYQHVTEDESLAMLDRLVAASGLFDIRPQCIGTILGPRVKAEEKSVKIDRVLIPEDKLLDAGWELGPIGIEAKRSGEKLGRAVSQALDYGRSAFEVRTGWHVVLEWVFVWPFAHPYGDIESVMAQHRIGFANAGWSEDGLFFGTGGTHILTWSPHNGISIRNTATGKHQGRR